MPRPPVLSKFESINHLPFSEDWLAKAINIINSKLESFTEGSYRNISSREINMSDLPSGIRPRVIEEIIRIYTIGGWKVNFTLSEPQKGEGWFFFT